jgi:hypothetical protein
MSAMRDRRLEEAGRQASKQANSLEAAQIEPGDDLRNIK